MSVGIKKVKAGGKTYTYPRNYASEYSDRTTTQKNNRVVRRKARSKLIDMMGASKLAGKDVDHIKGIGGGNSLKNLRVTSIAFNRGRKSVRWK